MSSAQSQLNAVFGQTAPGPLPDLNDGKYPYDLMYRLVNFAAYFNMFAVSQPTFNSAIKDSSHCGHVIGFQVHDALHRFEVNLQPATLQAGVTALNSTGQLAGKLSHRLMLIPDDFVASPFRQPPPTPLDISRSQRFAMYDGTIEFGDGKDGFRGFGTGRTYPVVTSGRPQLLVGASGEMLEGFGALAPLHGTYVLSGELSLEHGFQGNVHCRLMDPDFRIFTLDASEIPPLQAEKGPDLGLTYIVFGGKKPGKDSPTSYILGADGQPQGVTLNQELRNVEFKFTPEGPKGVRAFSFPHEVIGKMSANVFFNMLAPGVAGLSLTPISSTAALEFAFTDAQGQTVATITAEGGEGKIFHDTFSAAPGSAGWRFGTFQTLAKGTGRLAGAEGILTEISIASVAPYVTMAVYTLCLNDPEGKYRAAL